MLFIFCLFFVLKVFQQFRGLPFLPFLPSYHQFQLPFTHIVCSDVLSSPLFLFIQRRSKDVYGRMPFSVGVNEGGNYC